MRIALAVEGTRGDVHPMLDLALAFEDAGHQTVLCGPSNFRDVSDRKQIAFREIGSDTKTFLQEEAGAMSSRGLAAHGAQARYFKDTIERQFARLPEATRDVDLILAAGVQLAASSVAEYHDIPYRYIAYCPILIPSPAHAPAFLPTQDLPRWGNRIAWWLFENVADRLIRFPLNRERRRLGLPKTDSAMRGLLSRNPILASDRVLAPIPEESVLAVEQLGCFHAHQPEPLPEKLEDFLAAGAPPVYIGFGSMTDPDPEATTRMALAAIEAVGCRAILSQGWAGIGDGALCEGVIQIGPVSHAALFPRCSAIVHHGGAGTTTRSAQAGVPQIIVPHLLDQFWWGNRIADLGLAPRPLPRNTLNPEKLALALQSLQDNEAVVERAREIGQEIAPDPTPARAVEAILAGL